MHKCQIMSVPKKMNIVIIWDYYKLKTCCWCLGQFLWFIYGFIARKESFLAECFILSDFSPSFKILIMNFHPLWETANHFVILVFQFWTLTVWVNHLLELPSKWKKNVNGVHISCSGVLFRANYVQRLRFVFQ